MHNYVLPRDTPKKLLSPALLLALVLCMLTCFSVFCPTTAQAQEECHLGSCLGVRVHNYTEYRYRLDFTLCCNHTILITGCTVVAANSNTPLDFPHSCRLLEWRFCDDLPDGVCYSWYPDDCVLDIYECP